MGFGRSAGAGRGAEGRVGRLTLSVPRVPAAFLELVVGSDPVRRHDAPVLRATSSSGSVVMQARGGEEVTLTKRRGVLRIAE